IFWFFVFRPRRLRAFAGRPRRWGLDPLAAHLPRLTATCESFRLSMFWIVLRFDRCKKIRRLGLFRLVQDFSLLVGDEPRDLSSRRGATEVQTPLSRVPDNALAPNFRGGNERIQSSRQAFVILSLKITSREQIERCREPNQHQGQRRQ